MRAIELTLLGCCLWLGGTSKLVEAQAGEASSQSFTVGQPLAPIAGGVASERHPLDEICDYSEMIKRCPNDPSLRYGRALAYNRLCPPQSEKALADLCCALQAQPNNVSILLERAKTFLALGKSARALEDFNEVLRLNPSDPYARAARDTLVTVSGGTGLVDCPLAKDTNSCQPSTKDAAEAPGKDQGDGGASSQRTNGVPPTSSKPDTRLTDAINEAAIAEANARAATARAKVAEANAQAEEAAIRAARTKYDFGQRQKPVAATANQLADPLAEIKKLKEQLAETKKGIDAVGTAAVEKAKANAEIGQREREKAESERPASTKRGDNPK